MFNTTSYSLEDTPSKAVGEFPKPVICGPCYHALHPEKHAGSHPRSYAALAESQYTYRVIDWAGLSTRTCACCGTRNYTERHQVVMTRKVKRA